MTEAAVLAVDAGGTSCRAALCSRDGRVLSYVRGGSCNYHSIGSEQALKTLSSVLARLVEGQAGKESIDCAVFGMAGLDTENDRVVLTKLVQQALTVSGIAAKQVCLDNDAMLTLKASIGGENGIIIVSGTGSIACGQATNGRTARVGGWGYRVGDEGSGYFIGRAALTHVLRAYDGREQPSAIATALLQALSLADEAELANWIYSEQFSIQQVAALAPLVLQLSDGGDEKAMKIIDGASRELGCMALTVVRRLDLRDKPFELVLCGGILQAAVIRQSLAEFITSQCKTVTVAAAEHQPICANLRYGLRVLGVEDHAVLNGLSRQIHCLS